MAVRDQLIQRQISGNAEFGKTEGPVFVQASGRPVRPDWLTHRFHTLVQQSGLPPVRLHGLRHGAATLALAAHVDLKTVRYRLHASLVCPPSRPRCAAFPEDGIVESGADFRRAVTALQESNFTGLTTGS